MNGDITIEEIEQTIKKLKNKKTPGNGSITNEMIKCSDNLMLVKLEKLFNKTFKTGYYPNSWNEGLIFSIHKSGEKENPNNYRGITLSNSLGKLFNTILYNRLTTKLQNANILSPVKAGFRKNHRTPDHIFNLFSLIKKYVTKGNYLYICFVDFQKAYDSIRRDGLKDKLEKIGIIGKFLDIIHAMHKEPNTSLLYKKMVTEPFYTTIGLRQGDILKAIFFNLFINDLTSLLADTTNGNIEKLKLDNTNISSLLFVDDLAIF